MRVLVDIKHPAEVRFFQPLIEALEERNDTVRVTAHYKTQVAELMTALGMEHTAISRARPGVPGIVGSAVLRTIRLRRIARAFRPNVMVARVGVEIGAVGRMLGIPAVSFDENEYANVQLALSCALAHAVCTGMGYEKSLGRKQLRFNALPQLAYTHPARFTPDPGGLRAAGIEPEEPYVVLRLSGWKALHDLGRKRFQDNELLELIEAMEGHARVIVSHEGEAPPALKRWQVSLPVRDALNLLAFARLYVGEGGSMAAEATCLGTPAIWISSIRSGYLNILTQRYGLVEQLTELDAVRRSAVRHLEDADLKHETEKSHRRLLADSEDPVAFMLDVVNRYGAGG